MKQKQKNYKAGQIVTIDHKRYRLVNGPKDVSGCDICDFESIKGFEYPCAWCLTHVQNTVLKLL